MDPVKDAFLKIKEDIKRILDNLSFIKLEISELREYTIQNIERLNKEIKKAHDPYFSNQQTNKPTVNSYNPLLERLYNQNNIISIGNKGVPTNQQTNKPTNQQTEKGLISDFKRAHNTLNSLDNIRKEIYLKFKHLTDQEMRVFSVLYGLEEQNMEITYKTLSIKLFLSESSIRDYINKLINKGIPIEKMKKDNKIIYLKISNELKDLVSLSSILELRSL